MYRSVMRRVCQMPGLKKPRGGSVRANGDAIRDTARGRRNAECLVCEEGCLCTRSTSSMATIATFDEPSSDLIEGCFERPTPLLFVAGECQRPEWWDASVTFFLKRGCTVGSMALTGRGRSRTETLSLKALQAGVAAAVEQSGNAPPVIVAHSIAGFVCQQYLQSYPAAGLVLLDPYPPSPAALACSHLMLVYKAYMTDAGAMDHDNTLNSQELARQICDDPARFECILRCFFANAHRTGCWSLGPPVQHKSGGDERITPSSTVCSPRSTSIISRRFPARAFAQMCIGDQSANLELERQVVKSLVLGSDFLANYRKNPTGDNLHGEAGAGVWLEGLKTSAQLHGSGNWKLVDPTGNIMEAGGYLTPWQEVVWNWYNDNF